MTTLPIQCGVCGAELMRLRDPMLPPVPLGRIRICRRCRRAVCRQDSAKVGRDEFECVECDPTVKTKVRGRVPRPAQGGAPARARGGARPGT